MFSFRVLTYNVQAGKRIDRIIDWLNRIPHTDVICLQEFPQAYIKECITLLGRIPYGYSFAQAFTLRNKVYGELTLYRKDRWDSVRFQSVPLGINRLEKRVLKTTIPRTCLIATCRYKQIIIVVCNVHIVALATNRVKYEQVSRIMQTLNKKHTPVIFAGDFNISSLLGKRKLSKLMLESGYTSHTKRISTHRVGMIKHQFDYIFGNRCVVVKQYVDRVKLSDHFPLFADIEVT
jgi:endonuclease/exonuclease/phosphatase family metal-dependent hydrolase